MNKIPDEVMESVINFFLTNKNNTQKAIAENFKLKIYQINSILNKYFKEKKM